MRRHDLSDLSVFVMVAETGSFTKAAARLATSQSSVSQTIRRLEAHLGVRLLARTTRSVAVTESGAQLLATLKPALEEIADKIATLNVYRDRPAGLVRITSNHHAAGIVLWPAVNRILAVYPDIRVEIAIEAMLTDIVADRFDAGIRLGPQIARDMIAVRVGSDLRMAIIGSPAYFAARKIPVHPRELTEHRCINLRLPTRGDVPAWDFRRGKHVLRVRVEGALVVNDMGLMVTAAKAGHGLARVVEDVASDDIAAGTLVRVLTDWCPPIPGYHLYYPSGRQLSPAFRVVVDQLRMLAGG